MLALGFDTSCYTTSVALVEGSSVLKEIRRPLKVPPGEKGLRQAEGVFQHVQALPQLVEELGENVSLDNVGCVAASTRPRPQKGSYMPVFTVGEAFGRVVAAMLGIPFFATTHQEGHLMAGLWSAGAELGPRFLGVHLSGGTSEILLVTREEGKERFFGLEIVGGTTDLHAGQFVDRVGVYLGLSFPAGPSLEELAGRCSGRGARIPASVKGSWFSFSGPETHARRLIDGGEDPAVVARGVEECIADTLAKALSSAISSLGMKEVLVVGGVAANKRVREELVGRLQAPPLGARLFFADPGFTGDNAVGVALIGKELMKGRRS